MTVYTIHRCVFFSGLIFKPKYSYSFFPSVRPAFNQSCDYQTYYSTEIPTCLFDSSFWAIIHYTADISRSILEIMDCWQPIFKSWLLTSDISKNKSNMDKNDVPIILGYEFNNYFQKSIKSENKYFFFFLLLCLFSMPCHFPSSFLF